MRAKNTMRLDKLLSNLGHGSRREVREQIRAGRVRVDGQPQRDPGLLLDPERTRVEVDGEALSYRPFDLLMMHKPAGLITAAEDPRLPTVCGLLAPRYRASGVVPVGRLDRDTTGLLLLTNDGALAHRLISPRWHVSKTYWVEVDAPLSGEDAERFAQGIELSDFTALPARLKIVAERVGLLTLTEGKFHQVKRMMAARGKEVLALERVSFGPLSLDPALPPGAYRPLTEGEEAALRGAARTKEREHE